MRFYSWWCPSVNSFKFQPCDHRFHGNQKVTKACTSFFYGSSRAPVATPCGPRQAGCRGPHRACCSSGRLSRDDPSAHKRHNAIRKAEASRRRQGLLVLRPCRRGDGEAAARRPASVGHADPPSVARVSQRKVRQPSASGRHHCNSESGQEHALCRDCALCRLRNFHSALPPRYALPVGDSWTMQWLRRCFRRVIIYRGCSASLFSFHTSRALSGGAGLYLKPRTAPPGRGAARGPLTLSL